LSSVIRDRIALDFYRAAGVREKAVARTLGRQQIAELNKYADTLPFFSTDRKEFKEAARIAKQSRFQTETQEIARKEADGLRPHDFSARTIEQSPSHTTSITDRSDRKVNPVQTRRHFWRFYVEGFGVLSLREV
jgi:hypothetical protein